MKRKLLYALVALIIAFGCMPLFSGCGSRTAYTLAEDGDGNKYYIVSCTGYNSSYTGELNIPAYYGEGENYAPVREIAQQGFSMTNITSLTIPATVTKIGNAAFSYCTKLRRVDFAEGSELEELSRGIFGYCTALTEINLPESIKSIGMLAFTWCESLTGISLPGGLETIGLKAFYYAGLTDIIIPDSVNEIGIAAFHSCLNLELAVIGRGVTTVSAGAFGSCIKLAAVYLPATLEKIEGAHYTDGSEEKPLAEGMFYCGHAFHNDVALTDVYYGGTAEQWTALSANIESEALTVAGYNYDNSAVLQAVHHFGAEYGE